MKKIFLIILAGIIGFYSFSFAWNEFTYENAKKIANEYIKNSSFDENWQDKNPTLFGEGKYFYTESETPSYIEFKVSCDKNPDCGFIMVNFDGDDVAIPIASTSGNTPSEVLAAKNESKIDENTLYYFSPFEQYAENKRSGNISSIDPQDDFGYEVSKNERFSLQEVKIKKNSSLKEKIESNKKEAKTFKKSVEFKEIKQGLKEKKQTNGKEEVSFKYLDLAVADNPPIGTEFGYVKPASSDTYIPGTSLGICGSRVPCYDQFYTYYGGSYCRSGCAPTAMGMIFGYYDKTYSSSGAYNNLIDGTTTTFLNDTNSNIMIKKIGEYMGTFCTGDDTGGTYPSDIVKGIQYAKDRGYPNSTATAYSGTATTLFTTIKSEINAGRPVMLSNSTHAMVGYGYNSTSGLPIIRLNMGWGATGDIKDSAGTSYKYSNIDYNISSMYYKGASKTPINHLVIIKILK